MKTDTKNLKPGDRFHFKGDWETSPADWEVLSVDTLTGNPQCKCITGNSGIVSGFHTGVIVEIRQ
jgi:hypothetical protein